MDSESVRARLADDLQSRGIRDPRTLAAMAAVPREKFVPAAMLDLAYEDMPLPIESGQTISQPFIAAAMAEAARLEPGQRVLEVGTGSGYGAAVLSQMVGEQVYSIERDRELAQLALERLRRAGFLNVKVRHGDGTLGWPERAPFDAIVVTAGGPSMPPTLLRQLAIGGRLVMPIGPTPRAQRLVRITRQSEESFVREDLMDVQFVPLIGAEGWIADGAVRQVPGRVPSESLLIAESSLPLDDLETAPIAPLIERLAEGRVVLLGEASHGTSEFYRLRARITRELILRYGFRMVCIEGDWPDAERVDRYVRHRPRSEAPWVAFSRFPQWMWRNHETLEFVQWLRERNRLVGMEDRVSFHGLDIYSLRNSAAEVIRYLERIDPELAVTARELYACLAPWETDLAHYGAAAASGRYRSCETNVITMLRELLARRIELAERDGEEFFDAVMNARVVAAAEKHYRAMYLGSQDSWNLRDQHMFETLESLLEFRGPESRAVVWAHNSHVGDAQASEMFHRGQISLGHLCRERFGEAVQLCGFGTDHGTVAAAHNWDEPMQIMKVRPARPDSYEYLCHAASLSAFALHLRNPSSDALREQLMTPRLQRAIGVIYRPESELASHYFRASLPLLYDEYLWVDETHAVTAIEGRPTGEVPDTYPYGV